MSIKKQIQQEKVLLMDQIKNDLKQLTGYSVNFVLEEDKTYTLLFQKDNVVFPVKTELKSPVIPNTIIQSIADSVNALTEEDIKNNQIKQR